MSTKLGQNEHYLLGLLLHTVDEHIGCVWSFEDITTESFSLKQAKDALNILEDHDLAIHSTVSSPDRPRRADPMIQMSSRGLAYCLANEAKILNAMLSGGSVTYSERTREAYDRLRDREGVGVWEVLAKKIDKDTVKKFQEGAEALIVVIEQANIPPSEKRDALAYAYAVRDLASADNPPWKKIIDLLTSPVLTAFLNTAALASLILQGLA